MLPTLLSSMTLYEVGSGSPTCLGAALFRLVFFGTHDFPKNGESVEGNDKFWVRINQ